jgi:poly-gamma-glutamate synthase PgsB/CapB
MKLILLLLVLLTGLGGFEMIRHAYHRRRIPIRVHVNGSRGKSSVTRLIAAGLRAGGLRVMAKTTGSAARLIYPDGHENPVRRRGGPNIREQLKVFRTATSAQAEALVLECMAIRPDLQEVCEQRIVHATVGVITNARPDHSEIMGPSLDDIAGSLALTVPRHGHLVCADEQYSGFFAQRAAASHSGFTLARAADVTSAELTTLPYVEFPENVSAALAVCTALGISRSCALAGMQNVSPDIGALTRWRLRHREKELEFINAFAANDPVSYVRIWETLGSTLQPDRTIILVNLRADRQRRTKDLAPIIGRELQAKHYVLIGAKTRPFADMLKNQGVPASRIRDRGGDDAQEVWDLLCELADHGTAIVGVGNIAGVGLEFLSLLQAQENTA